MKIVVVSVEIDNSINVKYNLPYLINEFKT